MSKHEVKVVQIPKIEKHPNADALGLVEVEGCNVVVQLSAWKEGDLAAFIEPDYVVPETEQFAFLGKHRRIGTKRLRGIWSMGLLIPAPEGAQEGDDVMERLGIVRYEPETHGAVTGRKSYVTAADTAPGPKGLAVPGKYDLESIRKFWSAFEEGEEVVVTEKIHGANARYCYWDGEMHIGSRTRWVKHDGLNVWSRALLACPWIEEVCRACPGDILFGEVFGKVQDLRYGLGEEVTFRVFDWWCAEDEHDSSFSYPDRFMHAYCLHVPSEDVLVTPSRAVPVVYRGPFSKEKMLELAEGPSVFPGADHLREGIVIRPWMERTDRRLGRVIAKLVSNAYLAR